MLHQPQIVHVRAQRAAVIRLTVPRAEVRDAMGPAIREVLAAVTAQGIGPTGPVFSHHFRMDPETLDFDVGVPVRQSVAPTGRVLAVKLPEVRVARAIWEGPYEGLGGAWGEFGTWLAVNGHAPRPDMWECYVAGPETGRDPSRWRTELNRPLAG
jgi:effector-binding domain-containing protein